VATPLYPPVVQIWSGSCDCCSLSWLRRRPDCVSPGLTIHSSSYVQCPKKLILSTGTAVKKSGTYLYTA
jgi:hypothetical protein